MSDTWGPRAHPEKCDEFPHRPRKSIEESLGTMVGILILALILGGAILWWVQ